ncbi:SAM-dependent tRNA/rRNA cytosine-C5 methylase [Candidatus Woesearchaeota archaeon]|nr:SAM-dependent tRNA/rRNA cytosine-C5 methylase [Candidatus Woesearchaeota archaeon]
MESHLSRYRKLGADFNPEKIVIKPAFRINTLRIPPKDLLNRLNKQGVKLKKISWLEFGYFYESNFSLGATPEYLLGYYYLQAAPSQLAAEILDPQPNEMVLDMAAAPGGKTTHLAQLMNNKGVIIALDIETKRLQSLRNNLERLAISNTILYKKDARFITDFKKEFDKILLDAPCSGNFTLEEDWFKKRNLLDLPQMAKRQKELLNAAWKVLKKGGTLLYSTCSLEPEENELQLDTFLEKHSDAEILPIKQEAGSPAYTTIFEKELDPSISNAKRFWPHLHNVNGFFLALIKKK